MPDPYAAVMVAAMDPETATTFVHQAVPAAGRMGVAVEKLEPGFVRLRMPLAPNRNHIGTMYAGALFAVAELPGGILPLTVLTSGVMPIVTDVSITFHRAARSDVTLEARMDPAELARLGEVALAQGKSEFRLELSVRDADGMEVATTVATYQLRAPRTG